MDASILGLLPSRSPPLAIPIYTTTVKTSIQRRRRSLKLCSSNGTGREDDTPKPPTITPPDTVEIRFKRGSRKRRQRVREEEGVGAAQSLKAEPLSSDAPKKWEDMSLSEKAVELYMGEKGMLFWLNKFAYASIFIVIGGWIVFRFVGPALNLYQLDTPLLSPNSMFKGS